MPTQHAAPRYLGAPLQFDALNAAINAAKEETQAVYLQLQHAEEHCASLTCKLEEQRAAHAGKSGGLTAAASRSALSCVSCMPAHLPLLVTRAVPSTRLRGGCRH